MRKIFTLLVVAIALGSCSSGEYIQPGRQANVDISNVITPVKIMEYDADLSRKVEGVASGFLSKAVNVEYYKEQAVAKACIASNVDFMIDPVFTITTKGGMVTVTVVGYPAKYVEIRNAVPDDSIHIKFSRGPQQGPTQRKGQLKLIY
jgi:hypothetical protein